MICSSFKPYYLVFLFLLHISCLCSQSHTVYFIGDAGKDPLPGKTLQTLKKHIDLDSNSTVVFLGDNCYPKGINTKDLEVVDYPYAHPDAANLVSQLRILRKYSGNVFFVPGNHDWKAQKRHQAIRSIKNEELVISTYITDSTKVRNVVEHLAVFVWGGDNNMQKFVSHDLTNQLSIFLFDSQFYFQSMKGWSRKEKIAQLNDLIQQIDSLITIKEREGKKLIIASHHPIFTNGSHSRYRQPLRFLFNWTPLYLLGKLGVNRWLSQDIDQPFYSLYREKFLTLLEKHPGVYFLAGHDHNLQYITETDDHHLVSGAGSKSNKLRRKKRFEAAFMTDQKKGFVKLTFNESQECKISFISEDNQVLFEK